MLKQLLTGSALALLMAATPVVAQTDNATQAQPEAQATTPSAGATTGGTAGTTTGGTAGATTDSAQTDATTTDSSAATADSAESDTMQSDTAQSGEAMETETDAAASDEAMQETEAETATETTSPAGDNADEAAAELENELEADVETAETTDAAGTQQASGEMYIGEQMEDELLANSLIGTNVENPEGENLGSISDVIVTENDGIKAVVIGVGGFLGIGQKDVAVNYDQVEQTRDENGDLQLVLTTTKDDLENAPEFVSLEEKEEAARQQAEAPADAGGMGGGTMGSGTMGGGAAGTGATAPAGGATAPAGGTTQ